MFSTRARSSAHSPAGRQSSRRLQLAQLTSNFWVMGLNLLWMAMTADMGGLPSVRDGRALRDDLAHAFEILALVEEIARAQPPGKLAVGIGGEIGQHVEVDLGRGAAHPAQHV